MGATLYKKSISKAENFWQTARDFEISEVEQRLVQTKVELSLPLSLLDYIANYGTVTVQETTPAIASSSAFTASSSVSCSVTSSAATHHKPSTTPSGTFSSTSTTPFHSTAASPLQKPPSTPSSSLATTSSLTSPISTTTSSLAALSALVDPANVVNTLFRCDVVRMVTTLVGSAHGYANGNGLNAQFYNPWGLCMNPRDQCSYVCDYNNHAIRRVTLQGDVSTVVEGEMLQSPPAIVMDYKNDVFYVTCDGNHTVCKLTSAGSVSVFAGSGQEGDNDGTGTRASFCRLKGIAIDQESGTLFVCDCSKQMIRKISPQGVVSSLVRLEGDGKGIGHPWGICYDDSCQSLLVCDGGNRLRRIQMNGEVTTLCKVDRPSAVVMTANNTILVSSNANCIFKVTQKGDSYEVALLAGSGKQGRTDGRVGESSFSWPRGIAVDESSHTCFVADMRNNSIRKISFVD